MKVFIASPFSNPTCTSDYAVSLVALTQVLSKAHIPFEYYTVISSDIVLNRNVAAHRFLADPDATHLVMLDTDMRIENRVFQHFLDSGHPFMGAVYSRRKINLQKFHEMAQAGKDAATAKALASDFIVEFPSTTVSFANHFTPVSGIGFGCVMIARAVFEELIEQGLAPLITDRMSEQFGIGDTYHDFFRINRRDDGSYESEDIAFCRRTLQTQKFDIMGYIGPGVYHTGQFHYSTAYDLVLKDLM
ncbi:MAG: hypothetical protein AAFN94_12635 [Pseudomonadota bacterium]